MEYLVYGLIIGTILACLVIIATSDDEQPQSEPDQEEVERR